MGTLVKGDVVVLPFPFSDLSTSKRRPALVLAPLSGDDIICCMITTIQRGDGYSVALTNEDFDSGSLQHASAIRPNRLFTADGHIVSYTVGRLSQNKVQEVVDKLVEILGA